MEEWKEYKLIEIAVPIRDRIDTSVLDEDSYISTENMLPNKSGVITSSGVPKGNAIRFQEGDILISNIRPYFKKIWRADFVGGCSADVICLRANDKVNPLFLYYLLSQDLFFSYMMLGTKGTKMPRGDRNQIMQWGISLPGLKEQGHIASILKSLDDKIECNRRINDNLEQQAQALFKSWFVDFEPFKDGEFVESELGKIPKGWRVGTLLDNIHLMPGGTPSTNIEAYWKDGDIPFFSPKDVAGLYCFKTEKYITGTGLKKCSSHLYPKDTLFITARGTVGKITLAGVPMAINQSNYALVVKEGIGKYYLYLLVQTLVASFLKKANGAVFSAITTRDFNEPVIIPLDLDMKRFETLVSPIFKKIHQTCMDSYCLASLRDTLLPRLMSGELKVN